MNQLQAEQLTSIGAMLSRANEDDVLSAVIAEFLKAEKLMGTYPADYVHMPVVDRTFIFDDMVSKFIDNNPGAKILNLGCGFCTRYFRIGVDRDVTWIDADLGDVIAIKTEFMKRYSPELKKYSLRTIDARDAKAVHDVNADLLIMEGSIPYITEELAKKLITGYAIFDVLGIKREAALSHEQLWRFDEKKWPHLNILKSVDYDMKGGRAAHVLEVDQRGLASS